MGNAELREMIEEIDLGTIMDRELSFHKHVAVQVNKANQTLRLTKWSFVSLDEETLPVMFKALVHPLLEYGNIAWHPKFLMDIDVVEKVQRQIPRMIPLLREISYPERPRRLNVFAFLPPP